MDTITVETSELVGPSLDWAVAKCEGAGIYIKDGMLLISGVTWGYYKPSTDWAQGGPIIERERIAPAPRMFSEVTETGAEIYRHDGWTCAAKTTSYWITPKRQHGPTPLIAAMRCYVASKMGDTVQIPKELSL